MNDIYTNYDLCQNIFLRPTHKIYVTYMLNNNIFLTYGHNSFFSLYSRVFLIQNSIANSFCFLVQNNLKDSSEYLKHSL